MNDNIYIWIIGLLLGLVNFLFWGRIKRIERDLREATQKSEAIEKNYLSRFEELHHRLNEVEKNIIREIYNMKISAVSERRSRVSGQGPVSSFQRSEIRKQRPEKEGG